MDKIVENFFDQKGLRFDIDLAPLVAESVSTLEKSHEVVLKLIEENKSHLQSQLPWNCMLDMYLRSYGYCSGAVTCLIASQFPSAEALCRTCIEGAVNLHYVSLGDCMHNLIGYFKTHISTEREQNRKWRVSVKNTEAPEAVKNHHFEKIDEKDKAMDVLEKMLTESLSQSEIDFGSVESKWPSIFDRFRAIDDEVGYRTVYSGLCSQAHNDPEDILNNLFARVAVSCDDLAEGNRIQLIRFALYTCYLAIRYHITASAMFIAKFEINASELIEVRTRVDKSILQILEETPVLIEKGLKSH